MEYFPPKTPGWNMMTSQLLRILCNEGFSICHGSTLIDVIVIKDTARAVTPVVVPGTHTVKNNNILEFI